MRQTRRGPGNSPSSGELIRKRARASDHHDLCVAVIVSESEKQSEML